MKAIEDYHRSTVAMDQRNFFFIPHVLSIDAGQEVEFLNSDVANHGVTAASSEPKNRFNVSIALGGSDKHRFVASAHPVASRKSLTRSVILPHRTIAIGDIHDGELRPKAIA